MEGSLSSNTVSRQHDVMPNGSASPQNMRSMNALICAENEKQYTGVAYPMVSQRRRMP